MAFSLSVVDRVLAAYIINGGAGTSLDVLPAKASLEKTPPVTVCYCHSGEPPDFDPYSGNLMVQGYVEVRTSGIIQPSASEDRPRNDAESRTDATFKLFRFTDNNTGEGLGEAITQARGGETATIINARVKEVSQGFNPVHPNRNLGNIWVDCIHLEMLVSPGDTS